MGLAQRVNSDAIVLFYADFENIEGVNDPDRWNASSLREEHDGFKVESGRLKQTANGCGNSTKTLFPVDGSRWINYTVMMDIWPRDDDSFAIIFRYTDPENYYNFTINSNVNRWFLGNTVAPERDCPHGLPADTYLASGPIEDEINQNGETAYTMAVKVEGSRISIFFGEKTHWPEMPPKITEIVDDTHAKGTAGIYFASNPVDLDNIIVYEAED